MKKRVLITGAAGFIGSSLVRQAAGIFKEIVAVDNLVNGKWENIEPSGIQGLECVTADIRDIPAMAKMMKDIDIVYHLACLGVRHSIHSPGENHEVNASATLDLLALSREAGVKRFVYVSSSEIYGTAHIAPITEETPAFPHTIYGSSKLAGDCYARAYWDTYKFPTTVVRPFNSYGPRCHHEGDSGEVIPKFILRAMADKPLVIFGDGNQTRDFMYVEDTAYWIMRSGLEPEMVGKTVNLGSGIEISIGALALMILEIMGKPHGNILHDDPRPGDVLRLWADTALAKKFLGFAPRVSLDEGIRRLMAWYVDRKESPEELLKEEVVRNWIGK